MSAPVDFAELIGSMLAAHHFFMVHGYRGPSQVQAWSDGHRLQIEQELAAACDSYRALNLTDADDIRDRQLALASAVNWLPRPTFWVAISFGEHHA